MPSGLLGTCSYGSFSLLFKWLPTWEEAGLEAHLGGHQGGFFPCHMPWQCCHLAVSHWSLVQGALHGAATSGEVLGSSQPHRGEDWGFGVAEGSCCEPFIQL